MIRSLSIVSLFAAAVLAQSSSSSAPASAASSTSNPLIPSGISSGCQTFLTNLNKDTSLTSCTDPLIKAAGNYGPGGNSTNPSASEIKSTLATLCSPATTSQCTDNAVRSKLADFYSACSAELNNGNTDVKRTYDVMYLIVPMRNAICSKDDNGDYCVTKSPKGSSSAASSAGLSNNIVDTTQNLQKNLYYSIAADGSTLSRRAAAAALIPNTTTYASTNLPFFFLQSSDDSSTLCVSCTRSILTSYINFESSVPYAPGLSNSPMLKNQNDLYKAINDKCGKNFLSGAVQAAGSLSGSNVINAAPRSISGSSMVTVLSALIVTFASLH